LKNTAVIVYIMSGWTSITD